VGSSHPPPKPTLPLKIPAILPPITILRIKQNMSRANQKIVCLTKKLVDRFLEIFITSCNITISPHHHHSSHHRLATSTNFEQINARRHANPGAPDQLMPASGKLGFMYMINKLPRNIVYINLDIADIGHAKSYPYFSVKWVGVACEGESAPAHASQR